MAAFNYKTKYPEGVFSGIVKDALKGTMMGTEVNRSAVIKEASLILYLKETNIPELKIATI